MAPCDVMVRSHSQMMAANLYCPASREASGGWDDVTPLCTLQPFLSFPFPFPSSMAWPKWAVTLGKQLLAHKEKNFWNGGLQSEKISSSDARGAPEIPHCDHFLEWGLSRRLALWRFSVLIGCEEVGACGPHSGLPTFLGSWCFHMSYVGVGLEQQAYAFLIFLSNRVFNCWPFYMS